MNPQQDERSEFHGGFGKIYSMRMTLEKLSLHRKREQWSMVYRCLQDLYRELYAYTDEKEQQELDPKWKGLTAEFLKLKTQQNPQTSLPTLTFEVELILMRIMKKHRFDAALIQKENYGGAIV